jgi:para-nitrobenzyl esterase
MVGLPSASPRNRPLLGEHAFLYFFDHGYSAAEAAGLHAFHASELPYIFGTADHTPPAWPKLPETPEERRFSEAVASYWASFVRTGSPTASGKPARQPFAPWQGIYATGRCPSPRV